MDKLTRYREIIRQLIFAYATHKPANGQIEPEAVIDSERDHYEAVHVGWDGVRRVHGSVLHIDIINNKVWIQYDGTSELWRKRCWKLVFHAKILSWVSIL